MAIQTTELTRAFVYNNIPLPDPGPQFNVNQVRDLWAGTYPEIVNAAIEGPVEKDGQMLYTFRRAVGTKGLGTPDTTLVRELVDLASNTTGRVKFFALGDNSFCDGAILVIKDPAAVRDVLDLCFRKGFVVPDRDPRLAS
jgi:PRTRC genetic system protein C